MCVNSIAIARENVHLLAVDLARVVERRKTKVNEKWVFLMHPDDSQQLRATLHSCDVKAEQQVRS